VAHIVATVVAPIVPPVVAPCSGLCSGPCSGPCSGLYNGPYSGPTYARVVRGRSSRYNTDIFYNMGLTKITIQLLNGDIGELGRGGIWRRAVPYVRINIKHIIHKADYCVTETYKSSRVRRRCRRTVDHLGKVATRTPSTSDDRTVL